MPWVLGCNELVGDTAPSWLAIMIFGFIFSPFHVLATIGIMIGRALRNLCFGEIKYKARNDSVPHLVAIGTLGLSLLPVMLVIFCVVYPFVFLTRLYQICKLFFGGVLC